MKVLNTLAVYLSTASVSLAASHSECKCTPDSDCWPPEAEWQTLNRTISGALIKGVPPGSVCYPDQPNYNEEECTLVRSQWFNSSWHAADAISIDYPIWVNNSCNPIYLNGTSVTGDIYAGKKGCSMGNYAVYAVKATTAEQIAETLKWAGKHNVRSVIKSTGHSYSGRNTGYGSLSIWTHHLRGIEYIPSFNPTSCPTNGTFTAARVAAGETGGEVQIEMAKQNSIVVTGANPDVGVVGWLSSGGHGFLSTTYGMGADNLLEATIVTPHGEILVTNPCQHADLFFAIRGGGGSTYGVVAEVVLRTFPTPKTTRHIFKLSVLSPNTTTEYWNLMGYMHAEMPRLKSGGMQGYYFMVGPPTYPVHAFYWTFVLYDKPHGTVERLMAPIEEKLKSQAHIFGYQSDVIHGDTYLEVFGSSANEIVANIGSAYGSWLLSPESVSDPNATAKVLGEIGPSNDVSKPNGPISNPSLLGHMTASPNEPSYYPSVISMNPAWRNTLTHLVIVETWPDGIDQALIDSVYRDITQTKVQALRDLSPETGAYFNEPDSYEPKWQLAFFGKNYPKLLQIKRNIDPENVLWCQRCVGSETIIERNDKRLCRADREEGGGRQREGIQLDDSRGDVANETITLLQEFDIAIEAEGMERAN